MQSMEMYLIIDIVAMAVLSVPFVIKMLWEWWKIKSKYGINVFESQLNIFTLIFKGTIKNRDISKEALKPMRISLIGMNLITYLGIAICIFIILLM